MRLKCKCVSVDLYLLFLIFLLSEKSTLKDTNVPINKFQI